MPGKCTRRTAMRREENDDDEEDGDGNGDGDSDGNTLVLYGDARQSQSTRARCGRSSLECRLSLQALSRVTPPMRNLAHKPWYRRAENRRLRKSVAWARVAAHNQGREEIGGTCEFSH